MPLPEKVQAARKKQQKERLKMKGKPGYGEYFAKLPQQQMAAAENEKIVKAKGAIAAALEEVQLAEVTGIDLAGKQNELAVVTLVHSNLVDAKEARRRKPLLTAAGSAST